MANKKILVIDDDAELVSYMQALLSDNGYTVVTAADGKAGFAAAQKEKPDLICLDVTMPEESGIRCYRNLRDDKALAKTPVVIITGVTAEGGDPEPFKKFISTRRQVPPPDAFIPKPFERADLLAKIAELLVR